MKIANKVGAQNVFAISSGCFGMIVLLCFILIGELQMNASAAETIEFPPLVPDSEALVSADPTFSDACFARLREVADTSNWQFGESLLSHSETWGAVFRVDFTKPGAVVPPLVNRAVCWRSASDNALHVQIAIGQNIPPLAPRI